MTDTKIQLRGHCQCCGRVQAVRDASWMAHHGYTVTDGYFSGKCSGHKFAAIETDRKQADAMVTMVRADVIRQGEYLAGLKAGTVKPNVARSGKRVPGLRGRMMDEIVPFETAPSHHQQAAVDSAIWQTEMKIRSGTQWANDMVELIARVHGQPLQVVTLAPAADPIEPGDKRKAAPGSERVYVAQYVHGARVHWTITRDDGKKFTGWTGIAAWRKLETA